MPNGTPDTDLQRYVFEVTDQRLARLTFEISRVVRFSSEVAVHDLRVAVRRFSQALRIFKRCFRGKQVRRIRRELKHIITVGGEVRNCDMALKVLSKSKRQIPDAKPKLEARRHESERELQALLRIWVQRKSSRKWRSDLAATFSKNSVQFHRDLLKTARQALYLMAEDFFDRGSRAAQSKVSEDDLHQFRIACKKFRYTLEMFVAVYQNELKQGLMKIERVQSLLGDINDCEAARSLLSAFEGSESVLASLKKRQRKRIAEFQKYWVSTFGREGQKRAWKDLLSHPSATADFKKPADRNGTAPAWISGDASSAVA